MWQLAKMDDFCVSLHVYLVCFANSPRPPLRTISLIQLYCCHYWKLHDNEGIYVERNLHYMSEQKRPYLVARLFIKSETKPESSCRKCDSRRMMKETPQRERKRVHNASVEKRTERSGKREMEVSKCKQGNFGVALRGLLDKAKREEGYKESGLKYLRFYCCSRLTST
jgi:DNA-directed RNA polymerase subunit RPC12/RpoP